MFIERCDNKNADFKKTRIIFDLHVCYMKKKINKCETG